MEILLQPAERLAVPGLPAVGEVVFYVVSAAAVRRCSTPRLRCDYQGVSHD
jgi:hypothetical protein